MCLQVIAPIIKTLVSALGSSGRERGRRWCCVFSGCAGPCAELPNSLPCIRDRSFGTKQLTYGQASSSITACHATGYEPQYANTQGRNQLRNARGSLRHALRKTAMTCVVPANHSGIGTPASRCLYSSRVRGNKETKCRCGQEQAAQFAFIII